MQLREGGNGSSACGVLRLTDGVSGVGASETLRQQVRLAPVETEDEQRDRLARVDRGCCALGRLKASEERCYRPLELVYIECWRGLMHILPTDQV